MNKYKSIVIGGSAGSFQIITAIIESIPEGFNMSVFLALHRLKHIRKGFLEALSIKSKLPICEPHDKEIYIPGKIYLAPANYHMYVEPANNIALSTEPTVNHSRPSIDLTFKSAAYSLGEKLIGIILSGANRDGAEGIRAIKQNGGMTIIQEPDDCQVRTMPAAALEKAPDSKIMTSEEIVNFIKNLTSS